MTSDREQYTSGEYHNAVMPQRTATSHAGFYLPHLRSGMSLLDCGCGPGTITLGLAEAVAPGEIVGIDIGVEDIEKATAYARERGITNIRFQVASIYELPFDSESFDAIFAHGVLEHLSEPQKALAEMHRVLKTDGVAGVRSPDYGGHIYAPDDPIIDQSLDLIERFMNLNGGSRRLGRHFRAMLRGAGFARVQASAFYEYEGTPEATRREGQNMASIFQETGFRTRIIEQGIADNANMDSMAQAWLAWGDHPDAFRASPWCEAVGWKE